MRTAWLIFRAFAVVILLIGIIVPVGLYITLSTSWAQEKLCEVAEEQLSELLATDVEIGRVMLHPFNRISINDVKAKDSYGQTALTVDKIDAAFELRHFLMTGHTIIDYALVDGAKMRLYKETPDSKLNIADIIERLKSNNDEDKKTDINLKINTIVLLNSSLSYDVLSEPNKSVGTFDNNHIAISNLHLNAYIPKIGKDTYDVELDRFGFTEKSGFTLNNLSAKADVTDSYTSLSDFCIELNNSRLAFEPIRLEYSDLKHFGDAFTDTPTSIATDKDCYIYLPDLRAFAPDLDKINRTFNLDMSASGTKSSINLNKLSIIDSRDSQTAIFAQGHVSNFANIDSMLFDLKKLHIGANGSELANAASRLIPEKVGEILTRLNRFSIDATCSGYLSSATADITAKTTAGNIAVKGSFAALDSLRNISFDADATLDNLNIGQIIGDSRIGEIAGTTNVSANIHNKVVSGEADLQIDHVSYNGYTYQDIAITGESDGKQLTANLTIDDPNITSDLSTFLDYSSKVKAITLNGYLSGLNLNAIGVTHTPGTQVFSSNIDIDLTASNIDDIEGTAALSNLSIMNDKGNDLHIKNFEIELAPNASLPEINITSDILNGSIEGPYKFSTLPNAFKQIIGIIMPSLIPGYDASLYADAKTKLDNNFNFDFTISNAEEFAEYFNLPIQIIYPVSITGEVKEFNKYFIANVDAPYLQKGDKIIENTSLYVYGDAASQYGMFYGTTQMPTNKGPMTLIAGFTGTHDRLDSDIKWHIDRKIPLNGDFSFSTLFSRNDNNKICADIDFNPGDINFGNETWKIASSKIKYTPEAIDIDGFGLASDTQQIQIDGRIANTEDDKLKVSLKNVDLITIFETLEINKALISGRATGTFYASQLYSKEPQIYSDDLHVDGIGYNYCTLGDADIKAAWLNDKQAFQLDADITEPGGQKSRIYGCIYPASEALDINFDANHVKIGFMRPFMEAFTSDIDGYASGHARLFGTFKYIDMEGDIKAEDLRIKIDFTNTYYTANDSIHIKPGLIDVSNVTIRDINGNTALLNGKVWHKFFKEPSFDFQITNAHNFLSYNTTSKQNPDWFGTIYGNGSASITGEPGVVNIGVKMSTAPNSTFTFVLSDMVEVDDLAFITFRDKTPVDEDADKNDNNDIPAVVRAFQNKMVAMNTDTPSAYNMDIQVDITPQAQMILVMDPIGGDRIKANGSGNLRMTYGSVDNDLRMYGTYTLDQGSYNFTLQDIIIKDFTIKSGSSITFHGDPYSAQLDIDAIYALNANLSDLDESFSQDKDLNRTNVPVHALLQVNGDMRQPDISFDLEFPTLTSDTYRKVKSIVSTEEMMNQQIIYLLALNRFYTPEYMGSSTNHNELFSVASSTVASQLSNMLGKLSDNWSIAPNLRSDRGDFSDVEVDLALSSRLLNNRLLFNGNFGYRDKSLNTNQFIGDFDIEYLLNNRGTWRLKAYNRYNDQNYYLRTAATTQGVGIMLKRDFDNLFSWTKPIFSHKTDGKAEKADSTATVPATPIAVPTDSATTTETGATDWLIIK
jgi:hypothetical protein